LCWAGCNNAAGLIRPRLIDFTEELMQKAVRRNVRNTLRCCKAAHAGRRYGRIVNIGGGGGVPKPLADDGAVAVGDGCI
jgi:NAD(P)-dependent dehydrogenase (short-subunit alcohol dehydrogenase family)